MMLGKRGAPENAPRSIKEIFTRLGHHQQANSAIQRFLQGLVDELALPEDCVIDGGFKKPERILEKAAGHYDGKVGEVGDIRRFRILFDHPSTIQALRQMLGHVQSPTRFRNEVLKTRASRSAVTTIISGSRKPMAIPVFTSIWIST